MSPTDPPLSVAERANLLEEILQCRRKSREYKEASAAIEFLARARRSEPEHPTLMNLASKLTVKANSFSQAAADLGRQRSSC